MPGGSCTTTTRDQDGSNGGNRQVERHRTAGSVDLHGRHVTLLRQMIRSFGAILAPIR